MGDTDAARALIGFARSKLACMDDHLSRNGRVIGQNMIRLNDGSTIFMSRCLGQTSIVITTPIRQAEEKKGEYETRAPFPVVVSSELGTSVYAWDGLYNKKLVDVSTSANMVSSLAALGYFAYSEATFTGTVAEDWTYWDYSAPGEPPPYSATYAFYTGQEDQGVYVCAEYGGNPYQLNHSMYIPRVAIDITQSGTEYHLSWDYRYLSPTTSTSGVDVGPQALSVKRFAYWNDATRSAEWASLTGVPWSNTVQDYWEYNDKHLHVYPRWDFFYHSLFDISLSTPAVYVMIETMPDAGISMLDSWRDVKAGGFILAVGMNRSFGMDSVGGVVETENSIIVYECVSVIASLPVDYTGLSYTVTDDGTTHNDSGPLDADDETLLIGQILALTNQRRKEQGIPPLTINSKLTRAAQAHANDMALHDSLSHTGSDGSSASERITDSGYFDDLYPGSGTGTEENIATGYVTAETLMGTSGWMDPAGPHIANILDEDMWDIGIAVAYCKETWDWDGKKDRGKPYFVQTFGYRSDRKYKRLFRIWGHQKEGLPFHAKQVFERLNLVRTTAGVDALVENMAVWRAADRTARYGDGGQTLEERLSDAGYDMWVDKDYITIESHEVTADSYGAIIALISSDAEFISADYTEGSVGYYSDGTSESYSLIVASVPGRWPGLAPICTTGMDLYHFTRSNPVSATKQWVDTAPAPYEVESYRMPKVYAV